LLRRTSFGPFPGQVDAMAAAGNVDAAITSVLGETPPALGPPPKLNDGDPGDDPEQWWLRRMRVPGVGLHEKMTWFWHGHLTTSLDKVSRRMMWNQHLLVRQHALENFRTLLQAITVDPGTLVYLVAARSSADAPNEN
jgi:uncharacterized protein (DUF1800 family)